MIEIRHAQSHDALALSQLQRGIYGEATFFVGDKASSSQQLSHHLRQLNRRRSLYLVALVDSVLAGYLELNRMQAKKLEHSALLTVAIAPDFRRQGLGRRLLHKAYHWCEKVGVLRMELEVRAKNKAAIFLYEDEGFVLEGRKQQHVRLNKREFEDTLLMVKFFALSRVKRELEPPQGYALG